MAIRTFAYLDDQRVLSGLSQMVGAQPVRGKHVTSQANKKSVGAGFSVGPAQANAGIGKDGSTSTETETETTPDAAFQQLYERMDADDAIQALSSIDAGIWKQIKKGEMLEVEVRLEVFGLDLAIDNARNLGDMVQAIEPFMSLIPGVDDSTKKTMQTLKEVSSNQPADAPVPIICTLVGTPRYKFLCHLARGHIRTASLTELEGEWNILGTVKRLIPSTESYPIPAGITGRDLGQSTSRAARRSASKKPNNAGFNLEGPGAVLVPYAIYV